MIENRPSAPHPSETRPQAESPCARETARAEAVDASTEAGPTPGSPTQRPSTASLDGPSVARAAPVLSLVAWRDREKQEQVNRLLEMLDDLRRHVVAGEISTLAIAGISDGEEFCQWEGPEASVLYTLELAKEELLHGVRFGDQDEEELE